MRRAKGAGVMENAYDFTRPITDWEYPCIEISEPIEGVKLITLNRPYASTPFP